MSNKVQVAAAVAAMAGGRVGPLFDLLADDVVWQWMGVEHWPRAFTGKEVVRQVLFGGATDEMSPGSSVEVRHVHGDGDNVIVEHRGRNELADGRRYDNNYCWVLTLDAGRVVHVREYMDTQLVTDTFGPDES